VYFFFPSSVPSFFHNFFYIYFTKKKRMKNPFTSWNNELGYYIDPSEKYGHCTNNNVASGRWKLLLFQNNRQKNSTMDNIVHSLSSLLVICIDTIDFFIFSVFLFSKKGFTKKEAGWRIKVGRTWKKIIIIIIIHRMIQPWMRLKCCS